MAVVRSAIRGLGGELFVDSVLGQGTRFTIELPLTLMIGRRTDLEIGDPSEWRSRRSRCREIVPLRSHGVHAIREQRSAVASWTRVPLVDLSVLFKFRSRPGRARTCSSSAAIIISRDSSSTGFSAFAKSSCTLSPIRCIAVPGVSGATELPTVASDSFSTQRHS
jgi:chemotaxis protein histidine kinase CheA